MRYFLILSIFLFGCIKEDEMILKSPYQLRMSWECKGYACVNTDMLWTKQINLNNKIFYNIIPVYRNHDSNYQTFDVDITKLGATNDIKVILTFDCDTPNISQETIGNIRDNIPDYFDIKVEVLVNFYEDKRTVIQVSPSSDSNCNPDIRVFYE
ncbi:MAG: hypothetical protein ACJZZ9_03855 [Cytophagales bacterium]|tara:strand:+ start:512 stop:973 length:462 start_codon:yes stop_codon:yes gene_type:complete